MGFQEYLSNARGCFVFVSVLAVVTGLVFETLNKKLMDMVRSKPWCAQAMDLQKALMMNFGFKEEECTFEAKLDGYSFVIVLAGHHCLAACCMLPVFLMGWEAAGSTGQLLFVVGALSDVAFDMFDWFKNFCRTFLYSYIPWSSPCPLAPFIVLCCLHHPLAMSMVIPMVLHYPTMRSFHLIAVSLLLAAGVCFLSGAYKFTLDVKSKGGFMQYKAVVILQLVTIWFTRGYVWFTQVYVTLTTFRSHGDTNFFIAGSVAAVLMSLFNIVMILDATDAAKKWLLRPVPTEDGEHEELKVQIVRSTSSVLGVPDILTEILSPEAKQFRASVKVLVAANRFKKGISKKD